MIIQQQEEVGDAIFSMLARHYELNVSSVSSRTINLHLKRTEALKGKHPEMYQRPQHPQRQTTTTTTPPDEEEKNNKDSMLLMREIVKFSSRRWFGKQGCYSPSPPSSSTCSPSSSPNAASKVRPTSSIEAMVSPSPPTLLSGHHEESTLSATKDFLLPHQQPPTSSTSLTSKFPMVMELGDLLMSSLTACYRILSYLHLDSLLLPTVIYAEKFVRTLGQTDTSQVFDLFLTSTITAIKFWSDTPIANATFAKLLEIPLPLINRNELKFLTVIGYDLDLTESDINHYRALLVRT